MTAREVREFRTVSKRLVEIEERSKLLEELKKRKVCLSEEEMFVQNLHSKFKILGNRAGVKGKNREELVSLALKMKIRDNNLYGVKVRKRRDFLRGSLERSLGGRSSRCRTIVQEVKMNNHKHRQMLKKKFSKKVEHLTKKFGEKKNCEMDKSVLKIMGNPRIFEEDLGPEEIKKPVIVSSVDETVNLSEDELNVLKLGPKYCMFVDLDDEKFETDVEEMIMKTKWDLMSDDDRDKPGLEDIALNVLLGEEVCEEIDREKEEELRVAESKTPFNQGEMTFNLARRKATDMKGNSRVYFPKKSRSLEEEAALETLRVELLALFKVYVRKNCKKKGGAQSINLTHSQSKGLKSLKKRFSEGELVIIPTDKSGNLAILSRKLYKEAGMKHAMKDKEVDWERIREAQRELNGHVSMLIKCFRIGQYWDHGSRIRETTMGEGLSVCPLSLLFKDHKGWRADSGTAPPTRPVVGGHVGINLHISEIVSDILDPVVSTYEGGMEIISTEDLLARVEILNEKNESWTNTSFWAGMTTREYRSCDVCVGEDEQSWDDPGCTCDDGVDEDGRQMVTMKFMKKYRRQAWVSCNSWDSTDKERRVYGDQVLPEDLQDRTSPMVLVGTDVVNLYPSLDITKVVEEVRQAVMDSRIRWQEVDYLEASRYVALNWSAEQCKQSKLRRILPTRRYNTGTRPGLRGVGPQGSARGDQEQWVFPQVRLRHSEKKLLVATVVQLATEAMFHYHFYGFAGSKFQQMGGGPIGLRGTCTIARLVMQVFDKRWGVKVVQAGLQVELYVRYMDDGRVLLYPLKRGWRWESGRLVHCLRWEEEDAGRTLLDITVEALRLSMQGVADYLEFTYETGQDYEDAWLPTLDTNLWVSPTNQVMYKYFEKPTTTNTTLRMTTAMAENAKIQCLSNDLVRRLLNCKEDLPGSYRAEVIDNYGRKLRTSGYDLDLTRRILSNGIKGYMSKVRRRKMTGSRIHRTAQESSQGRSRKKLLGKSSWFRGRKKPEEEKEEHHVTHRGGGKKITKGAGGPGKELKTRSVLFVDQTPGGELAKQVREKLRDLEPILGYRLRVVERTGRNLLRSFPQTRSWKGEQCGRHDCVTCHQGGEEIAECTRANLVYESICTVCNPGAVKKGALEEVKGGNPSLYVGETSRSIQERAIEHWGAARRGAEDSHMCKHQAMEHEGEQPRFLFKVVTHHKTALSRQVHEAVRIRRRGGAGAILNSRAEFNRCHIPRLVVEVEEEGKKKKRLEQEQRDKEELSEIMKDMDLTWEQKKERERELKEKKRSRNPDPEEEMGSKPKRSRRMVYEVLREDWGDVDHGHGLGEDDQGEQPISVTPPHLPPLTPYLIEGGQSGISRNN